MALNVQKLALDIESALNKASQDTTNPAAARRQLAADLAGVIHMYITSATVSTTVLGTGPVGPITGTGTGTIS